MMRVTVAWHGTARSEAALTAAQRLVGRGDELVIVRVVTVHGNEESGRAVTAIRDEASASLERRAAELDTAASIRTELLQGIGGPAEQVLTFLEHTPSDILAVGVRRRSAVGKALLGSVAQALLLNAPCAVLAVKASGERSAADTDASERTVSLPADEEGPGSQPTG